MPDNKRMERPERAWDAGLELEAVYPAATVLTHG